MAISATTVTRTAGAADLTHDGIASATLGCARVRLDGGRPDVMQRDEDGNNHRSLHRNFLYSTHVSLQFGEQ